MLWSWRYNTILFLFSLPSSCLSALPCGLVPVTSFMDPLVYIGDIPDSRDCDSCEKSKCIGASVQITYMVCFVLFLKSVLREALRKGCESWQEKLVLTGRSGKTSPWGQQETSYVLSMGRIGTHTGQRGKGTKENHGPDVRRSRSYIVAGGWVPSGGWTDCQRQMTRVLHVSILV